CADFLVKSGLIHRCLQFNQAEISGYWHPSGADMPLSGDLGYRKGLYLIFKSGIIRALSWSMAGIRHFWERDK
ncbi:hypothetical protein, partial [Thiolapillus sp.]|uniref:hypothetical protein n=1 Tax=Thiolapillus sp. TaxID=2017437 RepID=UPI003AF9C3B2